MGIFFTVAGVGFGIYTDSFEEDKAVLCFDGHDIRSYAAEKFLNWFTEKEMT